MNNVQIRQLFEPYGTILSFVVESNKIGKYGFVCYDDPNNKKYGPECAMNAINGLNNKNMGNGIKLYVSHAMTKI